MITIRPLAALLVGMLIASSTGVAFAVPFTPVLDEFWINKNSTEIFRDSFADNIPPASGPDGPTTYSLVGPGGITSETGNKLTMTPSLGVPTGISGTYAEYSTVALRLLATSQTNSNFLGQDDSFEIHGLFDMSNLPMITGQSFGIRASDRAVNIGNLGNDTYVLFVGMDPMGDIVVALRHNDFAANLSTVIDSISIQSLLSGADQIEFMLSKAANADQLTASYVLFDINDIVLGSGSLGANTPLTIYDGELYIRGGFQSTEQVPVPEPATLALLGLGFAGITFARRRRVLA